MRKITQIIKLLMAVVMSLVVLESTAQMQLSTSNKPNQDESVRITTKTGVQPKDYTNADQIHGVKPVELDGIQIDPNAIYTYGDKSRALLFNNGPLVNFPGAGAGGLDASASQASIGHTLFGWGAQQTAGNSIADDFFICNEQWQLNTMTFFFYQTGSTTTSTITGVYLRIWKGHPTLPSSSIVWGDLTTNRLISTAFTNIYRVTETTLTNTQRPIMNAVANVSSCPVLLPGRYWVEVTATGSLASGPWMPPVTILNQQVTGDAWQKTTSGWAPALNNIYPNGMPFIIDGTSSSYTGQDIALVNIISPENSQAGTKNVTIELLNYGSSALSNVPVYFIFNAVQYDGTVPSLPVCTPVTFTFSQSINPSVGPHTITACVNYPGDDNPSNNCLSKDFIITPSYDCNWSIDLYDSYGDGWNGGTLDVIVDGFTLLDNITLASGFGPATFTFGVNTGSNIELVFTAGQWPDECYYEVYDHLDALVYASPGNYGGPPPSPYYLTGDCSVPECPSPSALYATDIKSDEALLGWTPGGDEKFWNVEIGSTGFTPGTGSEIISAYGLEDNPWLVTGLNPGTAYQFYVQADCGLSREVSNWAGPYAFTTYCVFECPTGTVAESELCGQDLNGGCNMQTPAFESVSPGSIICGTLWANNNLRDTDWFSLVLAEPSEVILHAYAEAPVIFGQLNYGAGTPGNPACPVTGFIANSTTELCTVKTLNLGILAAGTHWFWAGLPTFNGFPCDLRYWIEFEVNVVECPPPTGLVATILSVSSAELTWAAGGDETEWEVAVVPATDPVPTSGTVVYTTNFTATGLNLGQSYKAYVRAICLSRSQSTWTTVTFTVNYCSAGPTSAIDSDLFRVQITGPGLNFDHNVGCTGILGVQNFTGLGAIPLQQGVQYTMTVTMGQCGTGTYTNTAKAWIDYNKNVIYAEPEERLGVVTGPTSQTGVAYSFNFIVPVEAALGQTYMRVMQRETSDPSLVTPCAIYSWGSVHDYLIEINPPPSCPAPINLTASNITPTSADLDWTEVGSATQWNLEWGEAGFAQGSGTLVNGITTKPYPLTGLDPNTEYEFYVQSDCGDEARALSEWAGPIAFKTLCEAFNLPFSEDFSGIPDEGFPDCWSVTATGAENWFVSESNFAGGVSPEMLLIWGSPSFIGTSRLMTPVLNTGGATDFKISLNQFLDDWSTNEGDYIAIEYSVDGGNTWVEIWQFVTDVNYGPTFDEFSFSIPGGNDDFMIAFTFVGNSYNIDGWVIDNVLIVVEEPEVPENRNIDGVANLNDCYDATNTITVTNSTVPNGSIALFKAGVNIIFGDGFVVESGGYMHAEITTVYCNPPALLSVIEEAPAIVLPEITEPTALFRVYPNPTTGLFKMELLSGEDGDINVEIYNMMGERVFQDRLFGSMIYEFNLNNMPKGIYFIRAMRGSETGIEKVIRQ